MDSNRQWLDFGGCLNLWCNNPTAQLLSLHEALGSNCQLEFSGASAALPHWRPRIPTCQWFSECFYTKWSTVHTRILSQLTDGLAWHKLFQFCNINSGFQWLKSFLNNLTQSVRFFWVGSPLSPTPAADGQPKKHIFPEYPYTRNSSDWRYINCLALGRWWFFYIANLGTSSKKRNTNYRMLAGGFIFLLASIVNAAPPSIIPLSSAQVSSYKPFTLFASAAYCKLDTTINWSCNGTSFFWLWNGRGHRTFIASTMADCKANSDFIPVASGGNGASVQYCRRCSLNFGGLEWWNYVEGYVGFSPSQATVIVAHQGTKPSKMLV